MSDKSSNNKRIAKNTLSLYLRMAILMIVTLYSSRVLLQTLGVDDFGIYNVVGGFMAILAFFTSSLANVTQRYLNIGLGRKDNIITKHFFSQSFTVILFFSIALLLVAETIGFWFVYNKLNIPEDRHFAAMIVYQFSVLSVFCSINQTTFLGAIIAHERMNIYAYMGLFEGIARLLIIFVLQLSNLDHLILYGCLMFIISLLCTFIYIWYCTRFSIFTLKLTWDKPLVKEMGRFVGFNLFGCFAYSAGMQGTNVVMNLFFGPVVNASRGIALQVSSVAIRFTESVMTAIKPQIIKSYAAKDLGYMKLLLEKGSRYSLFLALFISVPILFKIDYILALWLGEVPKFAGVFTRLAILESIIGALITPLIIVANATGKILKNQIHGRLITLSVVIISYILLKIYPIPIIPMIIIGIAQIGYWLYCLLDISNQISLDLLTYFKKICLSPSLFAAIMLIVAFVLNKICPCNSLLVFLIEEVLIVIIEIFIVYFVLDKSEKTLVKTQLKTLKSKYYDS